MSRSICLVLGLLEFVLAADFFCSAPARIAENTLLPAILGTDYGARVVYCAFVLMLGCQRLTYAVSKPTTLSWLMLVLTHTIEAAFWWIMALEPSFRQGMSIPDLLVAAATMKTGAGFFGPLLLIGVPLLVVNFLLAGPPKTKKSDKRE